MQCYNNSSGFETKMSWLLRLCPPFPRVHVLNTNEERCTRFRQFARRHGFQFVNDIRRQPTS